jgi:hypothetical protein
MLAVSLRGTQAACSPADEPPGTPTTPPAAVETTTAVPTTTTPPADPTLGWTPYRDTVDHFSLRYPPGWQQRTCLGSPHTALFLGPSADALALCNSGFVGQMSVAAIPGDERATYHVTGTGAASASITVDGVSGTRETATASATDLGPPAGTRLVAYLFYTGGMTYRCSYAQAPSGPTSTDVLADFDLMVTRTFRFSA